MFDGDQAGSIVRVLLVSSFQYFGQFIPSCYELHMNEEELPELKKMNRQAS